MYCKEDALKFHDRLDQRNMNCPTSEPCPGIESKRSNVGQYRGVSLVKQKNAAMLNVLLERQLVDCCCCGCLDVRIRLRYVV